MRAKRPLDDLWRRSSEATAPGFAQKILIDHSHDFGFDGVETFAYVETQDANIQGNDLMASRVVAMIKQELVEGA